MTESEWGLMKELAKAQESGRTNDFYRMLSETDFTDYEGAARLAITLVELKEDVVAAHKESLLKFVNSIEQHRLDMRSDFRFAVLKKLLQLN